MNVRVIDRPGLNTPGEDAAWNPSRERVVVSGRPIGAPASIGFLGLAAVLTLSWLQLGRLPQEEGRHVALVLIGFVFLAQLLAAIFSFLARDFAGTVMALTGLTAALSKLVPAAVLLLASVRFLLAGGYHLTGDSRWLCTRLGRPSSKTPWAGRTLLPLGRRGKGEVAVTGSLLEQVKEVTTEPGVREQLQPRRQT
jgi:hypothetical protein